MHGKMCAGREQFGDFMRFFHISDLHIGKQLYYYSLRDSQQAILHEIIDKVREYRPDAVLVAGDIYDKAAPSGEAYELFDAFLNQFADIVPAVPLLIIAGNHDNALRLKYASAFLERHQIYISVLPPVEEEEYLKKVTLRDKYGEVNFYLLPYMRPGYVRHLFAEGAVRDENSAVAAVLAREAIDTSKRNVLLSHQFYVAGGRRPETCDSEITAILAGGIGGVDVSCLKPFDYAALGHIHGAQSVGEPHIRYSGTPLKYSVSEERHQKAITLVTMEEKGAPVRWEPIPLKPLYDVYSIQGTLRDVIDRAGKGVCDDFVSITLTDEESLYRPKDQLSEHYAHILEVKVDNRRSREQLAQDSCETESLEPMAAFRDFYQQMNGEPLSEEQENVMRRVIADVASGEV